MEQKTSCLHLCVLGRTPLGFVGFGRRRLGNNNVGGLELGLELLDLVVEEANDVIEVVGKAKDNCDAGGIVNHMLVQIGGPRSK